MAEEGEEKGRRGRKGKARKRGENETTAGKKDECGEKREREGGGRESRWEITIEGRKRDVGIKHKQ